MAFLYVNAKGQPWYRHSFSAGNTYDQSAKKYFLQKVLGWKEKDLLARFQYGKAIEETVQYFHEHNGEGAREFFKQRWQLEKDKKLTYTKVERDWENCLIMGDEHIRLYIIRQPSFPIPLGGATLFQREYEKEVFVGDPLYGGILDCGKLDIVSYVEPDHPMLPKLIWKPEYGPLRPVIIDMKAMAADLPESYGIVAFDSQLRRYSYQSGIRDVALLGFIKKSRSIQKGSSITLLEDAGMFKAGQEAVIAQVEGDDDVILVANDFMIEEMEKAQGKKEDGKTDQTKVAKARRDVWLQQFGVKVPTEIITKQRLQFNAGFVDVESAKEAGMIAARQIVSIVNSWHSKQWPNGFGIKFPRDDRSDPYFRAFILGDEAFRDANFIKSDEDSLDDLFAEIDTEAE
jgi:hypothetical protein